MRFPCRHEQWAEYAVALTGKCLRFPRMPDFLENHEPPVTSLLALHESDGIGNVDFARDVLQFYLA